MAERLRWWMIPGAMVVLVRAVTLGEPSAPEAGEVAAVPAVEMAGPVRLREASGGRSEDVAMALPTAQSLQVALPAEWARQRIVMTLWRRTDGRREAEPWLTLSPRVRADGAVPIVGLPRGRYDLEVSFGEGAAVVRRAADDVAVPGSVNLGRR